MHKRSGLSRPDSVEPKGGCSQITDRAPTASISVSPTASSRWQRASHQCPYEPHDRSGEGPVRPPEIQLIQSRSAAQVTGTPCDATHWANA
jgi:hypothetical protein